MGYYRIDSSFSGEYRTFVGTTRLAMLQQYKAGCAAKAAKGLYDGHVEKYNTSITLLLIEDTLKLKNKNNIKPKVKLNKFGY